MAKYRLRNGKDSVKCEILNESVGKYIVRFKNGKIKSVPKSSVRDLDRIDEGVVDAVRSGADAVKKFGRHVAGAFNNTKNAIKNISSKIKNFVISAFKKVKGFVLFFGANGKAINASHPLNMIKFAKSNSAVSFIPSETTVETCNELGIDAQAIYDIQTTLENAEYDGAVQPLAIAKLQESLERNFDKKNSLFENELFEDELGYVYIDAFTDTGDNAKYPNLSAEELVHKLEVAYADAQRFKLPTPLSNDKSTTDKKEKFIPASQAIAELKKRYGSIKDTSDKKNESAIDEAFVGSSGKPVDDENDAYGRMLPLMLFGAPGLGKTNIIEDVGRKKSHSKNSKYPNVIVIEGGGLVPDTLYMGVPVDDSTSHVKKDDFTSFAKGGNAKVESAVVSWLPMYNPTGMSEDELYINNEICNGRGIMRGDDGEIVFSDDEAPGGFLFIDEFTRVSYDLQNVMFNFPINRTLNGYVLGSKWVVVCAANRPKEMAGKAKEMAIEWESAGLSRFSKYNFVPSPAAWLNWATKTIGEKQKVCNEIVEFISCYSGTESKVVKDKKGKDITVYSDISAASYKKDDMEASFDAQKDKYGWLYKMYSNENENRCTACPRTWEALSSIFRSEARPIAQKEDIDYNEPLSAFDLSDIKNDEHPIRKAALSVVGKEPADAFCDYILLKQNFSSKYANKIFRGTMTKDDYDELRSKCYSVQFVGKIFDNPVIKKSLSDAAHAAVKTVSKEEMANNIVRFLVNVTKYDTGDKKIEKYSASAQILSTILNDVFCEAFKLKLESGIELYVSDKNLQNSFGVISDM